MSLLQFHFKANGLPFTASIEADSTSVFESFALHHKFTVASKKGEAVIDALLLHAMPGDIRSVTLTLRGEEHDSPNGRAAVTHYSRQGKILSEEHKECGKLNGENAWVIYYDNGRIREAFHYQSDQATDMKGEAAFRQYDENGVLRRCEWYDHGKLHDGLNGYQVEEFDEAGQRTRGDSMADIARKRQEAAEKLKNATTSEILKNAQERKNAEKDEKAKLQNALKKTFGKDFKLY